MKLRTLSFLLIVLLPITAAAQFTQVSATVTDPNGLAYANGTIVAKLVLPGGTSPTLNGLAYTPPSQPVGLNTVGFFLMQLADNNVLLPAATQWSFTVCSAAGTIQPAGGRGPVCFNAGPITITGASQSITATLNAAALALGLSGGGTVGTCGTTNSLAKYTAATTTGCSAVTEVSGVVTVSSPGINGQWTLNGATSGGASCTAPPVAGTITNPLTCTNYFSSPGYALTNSVIPVGVTGLFNGSGTNVQVFSNGTQAQLWQAAKTEIDGDISLATGFLWYSRTAPTIAAAGCGGAAASILNPNGTLAFKINVGTTPGSACTITMPAATTGWNVHCDDITTQSTSVFLQKQTGAESTTSVTITNFNDVAVATAFVASDILKCTAGAD